MSKTGRRSELIEEEASRWLVRLGSDDCSPLEYQKFRLWLEADDANREEFVEQSLIWNSLEELRGPYRAQLIQMVTDSVRASRRTRWLPHGQPKRLLWGASASVLCIVLGVFLFRSDLIQDRNVFSTVVGERRSIVLDDGSAVLLNTDTTLKWSMDDTARLVHLIHGEALFEVAFDGLPFIVRAGSAEIRVLGTTFNVYRRRDDHTTVTVLEGQVQIRAANVDEETAWQRQLNANQEIAYAEAGLETDVEDVIVSDHVAWRDGVWRGANTTLRALIEELNRYSTRKIIIVDPAINEIRVGGVMSILDIRKTLLSLQGITGLRIRESESAYYILPPDREAPEMSE